MQKRHLLPIEKKLILRDESPGRKRKRSETFSEDEDIPSFNADDEFAEGNAGFSHELLFQVRLWGCNVVLCKGCTLLSSCNHGRLTINADSCYAFQGRNVASRESFVSFKPK